MLFFWYWIKNYSLNLTILAKWHLEGHLQCLWWWNCVDGRDDLEAISVIPMIPHLNLITRYVWMILTALEYIFKKEFLENLFTLLSLGWIYLLLWALLVNITLFTRPLIYKFIEVFIWTCSKEKVYNSQTILHNGLLGCLRARHLIITLWHRLLHIFRRKLVTGRTMKKSIYVIKVRSWVLDYLLYTCELYC